MPTKREVRIVNPSSSGCGWTSLKQAAKYVLRGRARWNGTALEFIETDYRHKATGITAERIRQIEYDRACGSGMLDAAQMRHIPIVRPYLMLVRRTNLQTSATRMDAAQRNTRPHDARRPLTGLKKAA